MRLLREADSQPEPKGYLCARYFTGQVGAFNLHAARRAMHFPTGPPKVVSPLPPESAEEEFERGGEGESTD